MKDDVVIEEVGNLWENFSSADDSEALGQIIYVQV